jgi:hypothetical protein
MIGEEYWVMTVIRVCTENIRPSGSTVYQVHALRDDGKTMPRTLSTDVDHDLPVGNIVGYTWREPKTSWDLREEQA